MKNNWFIFVIWLLVAAVLYFGLLAVELSGCATRTADPQAGDGGVIEEDDESETRDDRSAGEDDDPDDATGDDGAGRDRDTRRSSDVSVDDVIEAVSEIRGLPVKSEIEVSYLDGDELAEVVEEEFKQEFSPAEVEAEEKALKSLDLIDPGIDLLDELEDLYLDQIAGFYDDQTKELALISEEAELDVMNEVTLAHEVTHALQDQSYDLAAFYPLEGPTTADANLARLALVEGDASLVMTQYMDDELSLSDMFSLGYDAGSGLGGLGSAPPYLEEALMFPYLDGEAFVTYLKEEGGWDVVNGAYLYPPESTEQIMHPEKYFEGDHPVFIGIPDLLPLAGPSWKLLYDDSFGEHDVFQLLYNGLLRGASQDGADGWGGGRFNYYERSDGAGMAVILTTWDSKLEAAEFILTMRDYLEYMYYSEFEFADRQFPILDDFEGSYWVMVQRGTAVLVARVPDKTLGNQLPAFILGAEPPKASVVDDMPPGSMLGGIGLPS